MAETKAHKKYMKAYRKERSAEAAVLVLQQRALKLIDAGILNDAQNLRVGYVRPAAEWVRSGRLLETYPERRQLNLSEALVAIDLGSGHLPWPRRWTAKQFDLCTKGWAMPPLDT